MERPLRVLLITDWMPSPGGAEEHATLVRDGLKAAGDEVRMLTSSAGSAAAGAADFVAYGTEHPAAQTVLQIVNPFAARACRTAVRVFRPDVALVQLFAYHLSPAVLWPLTDVPTALLVVDYKIVCPLGSKLLPDGRICEQRAGLVCWRSGCLSLPHWLRDEMRYAAIRPAVRRATSVLACSRHVQQVLGANGIESEHITLPVAPPSDGFVRRPADHPAFVFCGRLSVEKGVPLLIRAFARLLSRSPHAQLKIVGDGPLRRQIEGDVASLGLKDTVTFTGWLDAEGVERELANAWALVAPSTWAEPFGLVVPEAIVRGVPVIASAAGGFAETVVPEVSGLLFPSGDESALYDAMVRVADGELFPWHRLPEAVVANARITFGIEGHIGRLRAALQRIARRDGS